MLTIYTTASPGGTTSGTASFPSPKTFKVTMSDIDAESSKRNAKGVMTRDNVIRKRVRQLEVEFGPMTRTAMETTLRNFNTAANGLTVSDALTITSFVGNGTTTVTCNLSTTSGNEFQVGDKITIAGASGTEQAKLNGTWTIASSSGPLVFTFVVSSAVTAGTYTTTIGTTTNTTAVPANFMRIFYPDPENATYNTMRVFYLADKSVPLFNLQKALWEGVSFTLIEK